MLRAFPLLSTIITLLLPLLVWWVLHLVALLCQHYVSAPLARCIEILARVIGIVGLVVAIVANTWGPRHLVVRHEVYASPDVPAAFDGYRIAQFTDVHLASQQWQTDMVRQLVDTLLAQDADCICFTGDLVTLDCSEMSGYRTELSRLKARDGVFSVMGNHDYHLYTYTGFSERKQMQRLRKMIAREISLGWQLLLNDHRIITRGQDSICMGGSENYGVKHRFPKRGDLKKTFEGAKDVPFKILLTHDPTHWRSKVLPESDVALTLSGHTHAMQFMIGSWSPSKYDYPEWRGMYYEGKRALHVSSGFGGAGFPFRFGAWPEVVVITLKHCEK